MTIQPNRTKALVAVSNDTATTSGPRSPKNAHLRRPRRGHQSHPPRRICAHQIEKIRSRAWCGQGMRAQQPWSCQDTNPARELYRRSWAPLDDDQRALGIKLAGLRERKLEGLERVGQVKTLVAERPEGFEDGRCAHRATVTWHGAKNTRGCTLCMASPRRTTPGSSGSPLSYLKKREEASV